MAGFTGYITTDETVPSKSGLYLTDLTGVTLSLLEDLIKEGQSNYTDTFNYLYKKAQLNIRIDLQRKLSDRFHIDKKLITRETSAFKADPNITSGRAGIKISVNLPKYGRIQILSIGMYAEGTSPILGGTFYIQKDDEDGELLSTISGQLEEGRNLIEVYKDFEEKTLFISYDADDLILRQTSTKHYATNTCYYGDYACDFPCCGGEGSVYHINGGGLNIKFVLYCSMEKFILENLPLFEGALLYRLGVDVMKERIATQRINKTSVLTVERAVELLGIFNEDYMSALDSATANIKIQEDPICFMCKSTIRSKPNLP